MYNFVGTVFGSDYGLYLFSEKGQSHKCVFISRAEFQEREGGYYKKGIYGGFEVVVGVGGLLG